MMSFEEIVHLTQNFSFIYPFIMSIIWVIAGTHLIIITLFYNKGPQNRPELIKEPFVSIIIPCYNEGELIRETIAQIEQINYPNYEVLAVNDGSSDNTLEVLNDLADNYDFVRVINLTKNRGKSMAMRMGVMSSKAEYIVCIDGDVLLDVNSVAYLVYTLQFNSRVGGVAGNPRVRNRRSILGNLQTIEFSSLFTLIKRAQASTGRLFTISGAICAFKKTALQDVNFWGTDMITDDIDITWRLQLKGWRVHFQPSALGWVRMPETFIGLWNQRLRWAQGGAETLIKHWRKVLTTFNGLKMAFIMFEYLFSIIWSHSILFLLILSVISLSGITNIHIQEYIPAHAGLVLGIIFMIQAMLSALLNRKFEKMPVLQIIWMVWYPLIYWWMTAMTSIVGFYKALFKGKQQFATWKSPDRGLDL